VPLSVLLKPLVSSVNVVRQRKEDASKKKKLFVLRRRRMKKSSLHYVRSRD
jgi:hypothetical protein